MSKEYELQASRVLLVRLGKTTAICSLALILTATLFPYNFSFEERRILGSRFGLSTGFSPMIESRRSDLIIGADAALGQPFKGQIDELRIYRSALSALQISQDAERTFVPHRKASPDSPAIGSEDRQLEGLAASFSFNETSGTIARDDSSNGNVGELVNGPERITEGTRVALSFKRRGQYVRVPDSPSIDIAGQSLTISMWIKLEDSPSDGAIVEKPWHSVTRILNGLPGIPRLSVWCRIWKP